MLMAKPAVKWSLSPGSRHRMQLPGNRLRIQLKNPAVRCNCDATVPFVPWVITSRSLAHGGDYDHLRATGLGGLVDVLSVPLWQFHCRRVSDDRGGRYFEALAPVTGTFYELPRSTEVDIEIRATPPACSPRDSRRPPPSE